MIAYLITFWHDVLMGTDNPTGNATTANEEALATLVQLAGKRTRPIAADFLARHVMSLPGPWDWPVRLAAFEAVLRRVASGNAEEISVIHAPSAKGKGTRVLGAFQLGSPRHLGLVPYAVRVVALGPLHASCTCVDFRHNALGLCKHVVAVLKFLAEVPSRWQQALSQPLPIAQSGRLRWDPTHAGGGANDPLRALTWEPSLSGGAPDSSQIKWLRAADKSGGFLLGQTFPDDPGRRLKVVIALQALGARGVADEATLGVCKAERARLERVQALAAAKPALAAALRKCHRKLYDYQRVGIERFLFEGRLVLADDMGLGKTTQAIAASAALHRAKVVQRGLLIVPASLKPQWQREWADVTDLPLTLLETGGADRALFYKNARAGFVITNYEQVVRDLKHIRAWAPDLVILDEAQRIKNWATKTAEAVKQIESPYRLVLTGTPMENRLDELASVVEWVDRAALEPKWRLHPWHTQWADGAKETIGARNLGELRQRLQPVLLRRLRNEVLTELPPRQDTVIPIDLSEEQREAHDDLNQPIAKLAATARRRPLTPVEFLRLMSLLATQRVIANGMAQANFEGIWPGLRYRPPAPALLASLGSPKLLEFRELIRNLVITQGRKVVVFSQWRRMLELSGWAVGDLLGDAGRRALFFTGQEGARRRTQNLVDFHDDPAASVLFLSDAGGVGLNLQKASSACINLELPWNPAVLEQRIARIHRLGQKVPIDVYNLVSRDCIEERIAGIVSDKRALFKGLFEGSSDEVKFERSGSLLKIVERLAQPVAAGLAPAAEQAADEDIVTNEAAGSGSQAASAAASLDVLLDAALPAESAISVTSASAGDSSVAQLLGALKVERSPDGHLRIDAPPEAAWALVSLFEGMARLMSTKVATPDAISPSVHTTTQATSQMS